jgi:predicted TIM-barrel fold metal-dependent hydrolase
MATLPFTDTHVHFYDLTNPGLRYDWLEPEGEDIVLEDYSAIKALRYWADDFIAETRFHNVSRVVHVQAATGIADPVAETEWLQAFADRLGVPHGIVAYTDLADPKAVENLERHAESANLRGIRDLRYDEYLSDPQWRRGYAELERFGLVCCDDPALEEMPLGLKLAQEYPGITLCIDHAGFPRARDDDYFVRWQSQMRALASAENVVVKISGLGQCDHRWTVDSLRPWVLSCVEAFGVERSFFGTNWPVDRLFSSYGDVVDAYAQIISDFSDDEQRALFSGTADRVFRLDGPREPRG